MWKYLSYYKFDRKINRYLCLLWQNQWNFTMSNKGKIFCDREVGTAQKICHIFRHNFNDFSWSRMDFILESDLKKSY